MIAAVLFISFAVLLLIGAPIAVCLGVSSVISMIIQGAGRPLDTVMSSLPQLFSSSTSKFVLLAIPFFILAGNIMDKAQISKRLIRLAETCVGHLRGGLAIVCVIVSCFFAAISGSSVATAAIIGVVAFTLSVVGGMVGKRLGGLFQKRAELVGGVVLIAIGVKILIEHLSGG